MGSPMRMPEPTPIYRLIHICNLHIYLAREELHAPRHWPGDGLAWKANHDVKLIFYSPQQDNAVVVRAGAVFEGRIARARKM